MPKLAEQIAEALTPYKFHRLDLNWNAPGSQATGECPFCGGVKFFVGKENGVYSCKNCEAGYPSGSNGNAYSFLRKLYAESSASEADLELVASERGLKVKTLQRWGLVKSLIDGEWMLPGYGLKGEVNNLYRWSPVKQSDGSYKRKLMSTSTMAHCLFGVESWDDNKPDVRVLEGPWDGMRLEELLLEDMPEMLEQTNVVAVPGCETFKEDWIPLFTGKNVFLSFDNDHPKTLKNGKIKAPAGHTGMRLAAVKLRPVTASIHYLKWGEEGYDPDLASGFDTRDYLPLIKS